MESDDARNALRAADRAAAAPWIDYPPVPWWHPLFFAAYAAGLTLAIGLLDGLATAGVELVLVVVMLGYTRWYVRKRGTYPKGTPPQEIRRPLHLMIAGAVLIAVATFALGALVSVWLAAAFAAVTTSGGITAYEAAYARGAQRARDRLA